MERPEDDGTARVVIRAVFFDLGGVILRTEHEAPRQHLAGRLGMEYEDLVRLVFESDTSRKASVGAIREKEHWQAVATKLKRPNEAEAKWASLVLAGIHDRIEIWAEKQWSEYKRRIEGQADALAEKLGEIGIGLKV